MKLSHHGFSSRIPCLYRGLGTQCIHKVILSNWKLLIYIFKALCGDNNKNMNITYFIRNYIRSELIEANDEKLENMLKFSYIFKIISESFKKTKLNDYS